jgi:Fic-DOC domain mobile mystery protein B
MAGWDPIPGETPIDISHLRVKGVRDRAQLNALEAENIRKVVVKYLGKRPNRRSAPFSLSWMLRLHRQMFCDVWKWAGRTRKEDLNLGIKWYLIDESLEALAGDLAYWGEHGMNVLERAVRLHHRAVKIHPFQNGNGRWARMLANILLRLNGGSMTEWPEPEMGNASRIRKEYLDALQAADGGDYEPLMAVHQRFTPMPHRPIIAQPIAPKLGSRPSTLLNWTTQTPPVDDEKDSEK